MTKPLVSKKPVQTSRLRWGRKEDIKLFKEIYYLSKEGILTLDQLSRMDPEFDADDNPGLIKIANLLNWKSGMNHLLIRIQRRMLDNFSAREVVILKKL